MMPLERMREVLERLSLDAVLITDEKNQQYLSGFAFSDGCLLILKDAAFLVTDFRYKEAAEAEALGGYTVVIPEKRMDFLKKTMKDAGVRRLGFEGRALSYAEHKRYRESLRGVLLCDVGDGVDRLREIKSDAEIERIERAQSITDKAYAELLSVLTPKMTELEVAAELEYRMRRLGADGFAFQTIAVSGKASALPHGVPRPVKLESGFLTMDFGAEVGGYCSDMTRTVAIGRATEDMRTLYNTVLSAQKAALDFLCAGVLCSEADAVARRIIDARYKGAFGHSLGHGVGLYIHENPRLSAKNTETLLTEGHVVTVEPGIYLEGRYGCRIEDLVVIGPKGIRNLTKSPKELIEII
ncbi:MAG: aminopeptidase P family protein [Clostridia bacterium]|nr:aminopeptidase P family protein [Clostridia bacterium]